MDVVEHYRCVFTWRDIFWLIDGRDGNNFFSCTLCFPRDSLEQASTHVTQFDVEKLDPYPELRFSFVSMHGKSWVVSFEGITAKKVQEIFGCISSFVQASGDMELKRRVFPPRIHSCMHGLPKLVKEFRGRSFLPEEVERHVLGGKSFEEACGLERNR